MYDNIIRIVIIAMILIVILGTLAVILIVTNKSKPKYESVINPDIEADIEIPFGRKRKKKSPVKKEIRKIIERKGISDKIENMYMKAGFEGRGFDYFIAQNFKYIFFGIAMGVMVHIVFGNFLITGASFIIVSSLHIIDMFATISERKKYFVAKFPFFLKTMSFVMRNSANFSTAFRSVVEKTEDGVLKDIMIEILEEQTLNGGNFNEAFQKLVDKIDSEETREFVETIKNNAEKGIPIADSFNSQAESITTQTNNRKVKLIKNLDNKIMLPILAIIGALGLLIWGVLSFGI